MSIVSKLTVGLLAAAGMLAAQEVISLTKPADFNVPKRIVQTEDAFSFKGTGLILSAKSFVLDPAKKYEISGEFCQKDGKQVMAYLGFAPFDAKNRSITANMVNVVKNTLTEVAEDAKKGDQVIKVKDASKWNTKLKYSYIAFDAKEDYSDLPNRSRIPTVVPNAKQNGEVWEILLKKPLTKDVAAGTTVRQQLDGGSFIYTGGYGKLTAGKWVTRKGVISGIATFGNPAKKIWKGTEKVKVLILFTQGDKNSETIFRNIKVTEVE